MDGDGDPDLVSQLRVILDNTWAVYFNEGGGFNAGRTSSPYRIYFPGAYNDSPFPDRYVTSMGDVNGDGYSDVALLIANTIGMIYGDPPGRIGARSALINAGLIDRGPGNGAFGVDLNADGLGDVLAAFPRREYRSFLDRLILVRHEEMEEIYDYVGGYPNDPLQTLSRPGDLDGDGRAEVVVSTSCWPRLTEATCLRSRLQVYSAGRDGFWSEPSWTQIQELTAAAGIPGDLNGDGYDDMVVAVGNSSRDYGNGERLRILYGGPSMFTPGPEFALSATEPVLLLSPTPLY